MSKNTDHIDSVLAEAGSAYDAWRRTDLNVRVAVLRRAARLYVDEADALATAMALDMGKPIRQGRGEAGSCARILDYYADNAEELLSHQELGAGTPDAAIVELAPTGVILGIMPWNYPHYQLIRLIAPNLLLGNSILFKHAQICRRSSALVEDLFARAGAPRHVVRDSGFTHDETSAAIAHPVITGVSFTGGEVAGAAIARTAGGALKKVVLELGGNDPFIVFDDSRVGELAVLVAATRLSNAGQTCVSPKRIIVKQSLLEEFMGVFTSQFLAVVPGDPLVETTQLGPLATESAAHELRELLVGAQSSGVTILGDHSELARSGRMFTPMIALNPPRSHAIWKQELFGPIAVIVAAANADEALELANDSVYGLGATAFTSDTNEAKLFRDGLQCGMVSVNRLKGGSPEFPFGGIKLSGFGRELGAYGLREFANLRLVVSTEAPLN